ncbi:MAG: MATE family efflux transporter [Lachnospiraceae bacterium]|nr:MATE family efflux transporter [Lachnospiraceae bacterium]
MSAQQLERSISVSSILRFTFPTIIMMVFTSIYSMVDGIFISRLVGADAISATNIVYPVIYIVIGLGSMLGAGGNAVLAKKLGEGRSREACEDLSFFTLFSFLLVVGFSAFCLLAIKPLLYALGTNDRLYPYCRDYFFVSVCGFPAYMLQLIFQNYFITAGRPNLGLISSVAAGIINAILDYVFIAVFHLGISGAALATLTGYLIPAATGLIFFSHNKGGLCFRRPRLRLRLLLQALANGSSEFVSNVATALIFLVLNIVTLRVLGEDGLAAISIVLYSQFVFTAVYMGYSSGVAPLISYNYGAGNIQNLHRIFRICLGFVIASSVLMTVLPLFLAKPLMAVFTSRDSAVFSIAVHGFLVFSLGYLFAGLNIFSSAFFTAFSNGKVSAIISFSRTFALILPALLLLPHFIGGDGIWLAIPIAEALCFFLSLYFLKTRRIQYQY